jgi:hypothetical protein
MLLDIINRRQYPNIEVSFEYGFSNDDDPDLTLADGQHTVLLVKCYNSGPVFAKYVNVILHIPKYLVEPNSIRTFLKGTSEILDDGNQYVRVVKENIAAESFSKEGNIVGRGPGRYIPILPEQEHLTKIPLIDNFQNFQFSFTSQGPYLQWELYADNAPCKKGKIAMSNIKRIKTR